MVFPMKLATSMRIYTLFREISFFGIDPSFQLFLLSIMYINVKLWSIDELLNLYLNNIYI